MTARSSVATRAITRVSNRVRDPGVMNLGRGCGLLDHGLQGLGERPSPPVSEQAVAVVLHGCDWERLAALGDQVDRSVGKPLLEDEEHAGERGEDQRGAGGQGRGPAMTFERCDD
jgi:hypothetical protein